jgi:hypothetical protein
MYKASDLEIARKTGNPTAISQIFCGLIKILLHKKKNEILTGTVVSNRFCMSRTSHLWPLVLGFYRCQTLPCAAKRFSGRWEAGGLADLKLVESAKE